MATKPATTVLPVFFGTKAACLVDRLSFKTMVEMNPQVGRLLAPLAVSEPLLDSITCITVSYGSNRNREDFKRSLRDLHLESHGRQILTLFKVDQLVPFKEEYIDGVKRLLAKSIQLKTSGPTQDRASNASPAPAGETKPPARTTSDQ